MTITETPEDVTVMGVHLIYPDAEYTVGQVGDHFVTLSQIWDVCQSLAVYKVLGGLEDLRSAPIRLDFDLIPLQIIRLRIASPMEFVATAAGGGITIAFTGYALHLVARVLRYPEAIGAWIPRLVAGWQLGWGEAADARRARHITEREARRVTDLDTTATLSQLAGQLEISRMRPNVVEIMGAGDTPEDLAVALGEYEPPHEPNFKSPRS